MELDEIYGEYLKSLSESAQKKVSGALKTLENVIRKEPLQWLISDNADIQKAFKESNLAKPTQRQYKYALSDLQTYLKKHYTLKKEEIPPPKGAPALQLIRIKHPATCNKCGKNIEIGSWVDWSQDVIICEDCMIKTTSDKILLKKYRKYKEYDAMIHQARKELDLTEKQRLNLEDTILKLKREIKELKTNERLYHDYEGELSVLRREWNDLKNTQLPMLRTEEASLMSSITQKKEELKNLSEPQVVEKPIKKPVYIEVEKVIEKPIIQVVEKFIDYGIEIMCPIHREYKPIITYCRKECMDFINCPLYEKIVAGKLPPTARLRVTIPDEEKEDSEERGIA